MNFGDFEHIRTWQGGAGRYRLELYDPYRRQDGRDWLAYQFFCDGALIFEGADFGASPIHSIDGDQAVAGLLHCLALQPGDTDPDYFEHYTPPTDGLRGGGGGGAVEPGP